MSEVVWFVVIMGVASLGVLAIGTWEYRKDSRTLASQDRHAHRKAA